MGRLMASTLAVGPTLLPLFPPPGVPVPAPGAGHFGLDQHWVSPIAVGKLGDANNCV